MGKVDFTKVAGFEFKAGAWINISTWYEVEIRTGLDGMTALSRKGVCENGPVPFTPEMAEKLANLLDGCGIASWEREYEPVGYVVNDGDFWNLRVVLEDGTVMEREGSNAWPEGYRKLEEGLYELFGVPDEEERNPRVVPGKRGLLPDSYYFGQGPSYVPMLDKNGDIIPG